MKIFIASDHAGFELKEKIKKYLFEKNHDVKDCGALTYEKTDDYPDFVSEAAEQVAWNINSVGIVFGKSGSGEEIVANKIKGVRAILGFSEENVRLGRIHNNANVLALGSEFIDENKAKKLIEIFLNTPFSKASRHRRRVEEIKEIENS